jgi:hypothetical protein
LPKGRAAARAAARPFLRLPLELHVPHDLPPEFVFPARRLYRYREIRC